MLLVTMKIQFLVFLCFLFFFFNDTATTEIYTLSLHDALPIFGPEKYVLTGSPVLSRNMSCPNSRTRSRHSRSVRVSCQLIALWTGSPLRRSHSTVVSR